MNNQSSSVHTIKSLPGYKKISQELYEQHILTLIPCLGMKTYFVNNISSINTYVFVKEINCTQN